MKIYISKGLNGDDADFAMPEGQARNLVNIRYGSTDEGRTGQLENIPSTINISYELPVGVNRCIGAAVDDERNRFVWFNKNSLGSHGIYCYENGTVYKVLLSSGVNGGLNLTNYIHSARVSDGLLYWTDDNEEPCRLNIDAGIKAYQNNYSTTQAPYVLPLNKSVIRLIRRPPAFPLQLQKLSSQDPSFTKYEPTQFLYRYKYRDGETSVFSPLSDLVNFNLETDTYNQIKVKLPYAEFIEQDVQEIELAVKFLQSNKHFSIKTWTRDKDASLFNQHNSQSAQLAYDFFNAQLGISIDDAAAAKPFDNVPLRSKTLEIAKNRLFLGNNLKGYDINSNANISLTGSFSIPNGAQLTGRWFKFTFRTTQGQGTIYLIDITGIGNDSGFYTVVDVEQPPFPANVNYNQCIFQGAGSADVFARYGVTFSDVIEFAGLGSVSNVLNGPSIETQIGGRVFKSDCQYQFGVTFFDHSGRKQMVTNESLTLRTPDRTLTNISFTNAFNWQLTSVVSEIPAWAEYYSIVMTKALRTRFFIQLRADDMRYVTKSNNEYAFTATTYDSKAYGIGIKISSLFSYNIGYTFSEGDLVKLWVGANIVTLNIKFQQGDWIVCDLQNVGTLGDTVQAVYEIFTPHKSTQELFYEIGDVYTVLNPGTNQRALSVTSGSIQGDVYILERNNEGQHSVEAMSPNDKFWKNWHTAHGRPNLPDTIGQQRKKYSICYSNVYLNKKTNGYSSFDPLDEKELDNEFGAIQKLQLTSKTQEDGSVMLAICQNETASIYLGETQLVSQTGNAFVAAAPGVIGTVNALKGSYGTNHPESVKEHKGLVFWWDQINGTVVQYSVNGLDPISMNKMQRVFSKFGQQGAEFCIGGIDPKHNEYLLGGLYDTYMYDPFQQSTILNELDPANCPPRLWRYPYLQESWAGTVDMNPECIVNIGVKLFMFYGGGLYVCNEASSYNNFFGTQYPSVVACIINGDPAKIKSYLAVSLESNIAPTATFYTKEPNEQVTDLLPTDFEKREGVFYSALFRDKLSPNINADVTQKMLRGDRMRSPALNAQFNFDTSSRLEVKFINVTYNLSKGH